MKIIYTVVFFLTEIFNYIDFSSQFECLPNGAPIHGVPRSKPSSFFDIQEPPASYVPPVIPVSPAISVPPARSRSPHRSHSPAEPFKRLRTRSPPTRYIPSNIRLPSFDGNGYGLDQLEFVRLTPIKNLHREFHFQRYTFASDKRIKILTGHTIYKPVPTEEQIVLTTSDGDIFAILLNMDTLSGIYKHLRQIKANKRMKTNMKSGVITPLTPEETEEVPVGHRRPILHNFRVENVNDRKRSSSPAKPILLVRAKAHPANLPSNVLGYGLDQIQFIRLRNKENPHRLFGVQRYTFPADKLVKILIGQNNFRLMPVEEKIVLSTFGGDVFATFESSDVLSGIYVHNRRIRSEARARVNMVSGIVTFLTADEIRETPVGTRRPLSVNFMVDFVKENQTDHQKENLN